MESFRINRVQPVKHKNIPGFLRGVPTPKGTNLQFDQFSGKWENFGPGGSLAIS